MSNKSLKPGEPGGKKIRHALLVGYTPWNENETMRDSDAASSHSKSSGNNGSSLKRKSTDSGESITVQEGLALPPQQPELKRQKQCLQNNSQATAIMNAAMQSTQTTSHQTIHTYDAMIQNAAPYFQTQNWLLPNNNGHYPSHDMQMSNQAIQNFYGCWQNPAYQNTMAVNTAYNPQYWNQYAQQRHYHHSAHTYHPLPTNYNDVNRTFVPPSADNAELKQSAEVPTLSIACCHENLDPAKIPQNPLDEELWESTTSLEKEIAWIVEETSFLLPHSLLKGLSSTDSNPMLFDLAWLFGSLKLREELFNKSFAIVKSKLSDVEMSLEGLSRKYYDATFKSVNGVILIDANRFLPSTEGKATQQFKQLRHEAHNGLKLGFRRSDSLAKLLDLVSRFRLRRALEERGTAANHAFDTIAVKNVRRRRKRKSGSSNQHGDAANLTASQMERIAMQSPTDLNGQEEEIAWLCEESLILLPNEMPTDNSKPWGSQISVSAGLVTASPGVDWTYVMENASEALNKQLQKVRGGVSNRTLSRIVRYSNIDVRVAFSKRCDEVANLLIGGYRRPQTQDILPTNDTLIQTGFLDILKVKLSRRLQQRCKADDLASAKDLKSACRLRLSEKPSTSKPNKTKGRVEGPAVNDSKKSCVSQPHPHSWHCAKCGKVSSLNKKRCSDMYCQSWNGGTRENIGLSQANQQLLRNCDNTLRSAKLLPGKHISQQPQICNNTLQGGKLMHPTMHWPKQTSQSCDVQSSETFSAPSLDVSTETCLRRLHPTSILTRNEEEIAWLREEFEVETGGMKGYDWAYIEKYSTPRLKKEMLRCGVLISDFPTVAGVSKLRAMVRLHDRSVNNAFQSKRRDIRWAIKCGFRRDLREDVLPVISPAPPKISGTRVIDIEYANGYCPALDFTIELPDECNRFHAANAESVDQPFSYEFSPPDYHVEASSVYDAVTECGDFNRSDFLSSDDEPSKNRPETSTSEEPTDGKDADFDPEIPEDFDPEDSEAQNQQVSSEYSEDDDSDASGDEE